ncbi:shufflon system plasmid conjugative transfer pilus tip adhesin PilV, partial [Citrobacter freundii]|uniref:shufflon system plasmid conjugative transfer pilus tip adhesin PilV n=1 Tax=Citrobacter freundii TaxID=546 RepID=UPI0040436C88
MDRINVAGIACYPNGQISRDANGGVLSCQSGAWANSGEKKIQRYTWSVNSGNNYGDICQTSLNS